MKIKFVHYLFLPTSVVVVWWLLGIPLLVFPSSIFLQSNAYLNIFEEFLLGSMGVLLIVELVRLIRIRQYKNLAALLIGIPIAVLIGLTSVILLFSTGILGR